MQDGSEYNFIYNDGDYQIREEEILNEDKNADAMVRKYYQVDKNYHLIASFKDKKEAFLWVGWKSQRDLKDSFKEAGVPVVDNPKETNVLDFKETDKLPKGLISL